MKMKKRVLVTPLNWGLGHATRCIPVINEFIKQGAEVLIAADGRPLDLLKKEFPSLRFIELPGYNVEYSSSGSMVFKMLLLAPKIIASIKNEHELLEEIVTKQEIDLVFSDNRYGCWSNKARSVFMTHQIYIQCPVHLKWFEPALFKINKSYISKFSECWVPDFEGYENLSGNLSHKVKLIGIKFIGPLSRFAEKKIAKNHSPKYDVIIICSGPEPQRTIFEKLLTEEILKTNFNAVVVRGVTEGGKTSEQKNNLLIISYTDAAELQSLIESSEIVISRPGYSTIMDLAKFGKKAIFIPTPGQTEQEYLSKYFMNKNIFFSTAQNDFNLKEALQKANSFSGIKVPFQPELLSNAVSSMLSKLN